MTENNRTCLVCGAKYKYCGSCVTYKDQPIWRTNYDTEDCKKLYSIYEKYALGYITADEANKELSTIKTVDFGSVAPGIAKVVADIKANATPKPRQKKRTTKKDIVNEN